MRRDASAPAPAASGADRRARRPAPCDAASPARPPPPPPLAGARAGADAHALTGDARLSPPTHPRPRSHRINTRACIVGLVSLFVLEGLFGRPFLELIGISIGHGLGFEI